MKTTFTFVAFVAAFCLVNSSLSTAGGLSVQLVQTDTADCSALCEGEVEVQVAGGSALTFEWSNGATTALLEDVCPGVYSVTVTDALGNTASDSITVITFPDPVIAFDVSPSCGFLNPGSLDASVANGEAPFSFAWSNGESTEDISGLFPGVYAVTVTDDNGCVVVDSVEVPGSFPYSFLAVITNPTCGQSDGAISLDVSGGTPPLTMLWNTGSTTDEITNVPAGTYTFTVTDAYGCVGLYMEDLHPDGAPVACINDFGPQCSCTLALAAEFSVCAPETGVSYQWILNGATPAIVNDTIAAVAYNSAGSFDVTLIADNGGGCPDTLTFESYVHVGSPEAVVIASDDTITVNETLTVQGSAASGYLWSVTPALNVTIDSVTAQNISVDFSQPGTYNVCLTAVHFDWCSGCDTVETCATVVVEDTATSVPANNLNVPVIRVSNNGDGSVRFDYTVAGKLSVYDVMGREVEKIMLTRAGSHALNLLSRQVLLYRFEEKTGSVYSGRIFMHR